MPVEVATFAENQALESRVVILEAGSGGGGSGMPAYHESPVAERYADMPVRSDSSGRRCIMFIPMSKPVVGELWDISAEIHVTNNDLRSRGKGLHLTSEVRLGEATNHDRDGVSLIKASGSFNVGVEAHHGLILRRRVIKWTQDKVNAIPAGFTDHYIKFIIWAGSTAAQSGDRCEITPNRGHLECLQYLP